MAFIQREKDALIYMSSDKIAAPHAFTTRLGGVSRGIWESLNLGSDRGDEPQAVRENYRCLCALMGVGEDGMCVTRQVHGNVVKVVTGENRHRPFQTVPYEADGLVTGERGLPLLCLVADCVPVLLWDRKGRAVGAIHCGWRSSVGDILKNAIRAMEALGAKAEDIHAALGPSIGPCCFETDDDVPRAIDRYLDGDSAGTYRLRQDGKYLVDLRMANAKRLIQLGLREEDIDISKECTYCSHDKYWSHRYTKGRRGSQGAAIALGREG